MPGNKYLSNAAGTVTEVIATQTSVGVADAGKIPALDANGLLASAMMPTGIAADTASVLTSEALAAGDFVNVYNLVAVANVRKADATTAGKEANGFVLQAYAIATQATVYGIGNNNAVSGRTPGKQFLSTTAGSSTVTAPSASGNVVQVIGAATSATNIDFVPGHVIVLA